MPQPAYSDVMNGNSNSVRCGMTIIELLVALAVLGILVAIGFINLPRDGFALRQAAEGMTRDVQYARFLAITSNTYVAFEIDATADRYAVVERDSGEVLKTVNVGTDARAPRIEISAVDAPANRLVFDPRGVGIGLGPQQVTLSSVASPQQEVVLISQQGRAVIQ